MTSASPWESWWQAVSLDPHLTAAVDKRHAVFDARHHEEFTPPAEWHELRPEPQSIFSVFS